MKTEEIKAGDTVILKSGGVIMTVEEVTDTRVKCHFYCDKTGEFKEKLFPVIILKKSD